MINSLNNTFRNRLTRQQLELINRKSLRYPLPFAEKDYFLALAIQLIYNSQLGEKPIISTNIEKNWMIAQEQIQSDISNIFCKEELHHHAIDTLVKNITFEDMRDVH